VFPGEIVGVVVVVVIACQLCDVGE